MEFEPVGAVVSAKVRPIAGSDSAADLFARGVALEEHPSTHDEAIEVYLQGAAVRAEPRCRAHQSRNALLQPSGFRLPPKSITASRLQSDPRYALAYFDLGNVLDETGRIDDAIDAYRTAIQLAPTYADAHYNLALAYERQRQPRRALEHWKAYARARPNGAVVGACPQSDRAHPGRRQTQDGLSPAEVIAPPIPTFCSACRPNRVGKCSCSVSACGRDLRERTKRHATRRIAQYAKLLKDKCLSRLRTCGHVVALMTCSIFGEPSG